MYAHRLLAWWAVALAGGLLLRTHVSRQRAGRGRLALVLLLGLANWAVPLLFDRRTEQTTLIASFIITAALSTMKVSMWSCPSALPCWGELLLRLLHLGCLILISRQAGEGPHRSVRSMQVFLQRECRPQAGATLRHCFS